MVKNRKNYLKNMKGRMALIITGLSTGILMMSGCNKDTSGTVDDKSEVILSEIPSEEVSEIQSEEVSEEVSEVIAEEDPYQHIPEELLDENGIYHPAEVTADMLRERFADVDKYVESHGFNENAKDNIKASIMRANYSYMSDDTFKEVIEEYSIDITNEHNYNYYDEDDFPVEKMTFDPYLQYEARAFYDVHYEIAEAQKNNDTTGFYDAKRKLNYMMKNGDNLPIVPVYGGKSNLYDKTDFICPVAIFELSYGINKLNYSYMPEETPQENIQYGSLLGKIANELDAKVLAK